VALAERCWQVRLSAEGVTRTITADDLLPASPQTGATSSPR
jgi:hypothetical protein